MRTLAVDLGDRRVGLALSDSGGALASPLEVLTVATPADALRRVLEVIAQEHVLRVVIGLPLNMDGTLSAQCRKSLRFAADLRASAASVELIYVDERLSSFDAEQQLIEQKRAGRKLTRQDKKHRQDALAAASFLQAFLDGQLGPLDVQDGSRPS